MLNSSVSGDSGKASVRRSAFSQTCALLSRYVKEKKAFGDIGFEVASKIGGRDSNNPVRQTTMNLFPVNQMGEAVQTLANDKSGKQASSNAQMPTISSEIESAPMTIFYGGQVIVINDFPAHKAKEIMELASMGIFQSSNDTMNGRSSISTSMLDLGSLIPPNLPAQKVIPTVINDLPQKRRASLHRFMGKRKERVAARAPYTTRKPKNEPSNLNEASPWLGLAAAGAGPR